MWTYSFRFLLLRSKIHAAYCIQCGHQKQAIFFCGTYFMGARMRRSITYLPCMMEDKQQSAAHLLHGQSRSAHIHGLKTGSTRETTALARTINPRNHAIPIHPQSAAPPNPPRPSNGQNTDDKRTQQRVCGRDGARPSRGERGGHRIRCVLARRCQADQGPSRAPCRTARTASASHRAQPARS